MGYNIGSPVSSFLKIQLSKLLFPYLMLELSEMGPFLIQIPVFQNQNLKCIPLKLKRSKAFTCFR